jgi:hypothetical protein
MKLMKALIPTCSLILVLSTLAFAQVDSNPPLVICVHGIGEGNREPGWSREFGAAWGVETHEVTFGYEGRTKLESFYDFGQKTGDWVRSAQQQITQIVRENPGRPIIIVSHSWGSVVTKLALEGGSANGVLFDDINLGGALVAEWITINSLLGDPKVRSLAGVTTEVGRPKNVKQWTNFYDVNDWISKFSHNLVGAENAPVDSGAVNPHTAIWTDEKVTEYIKNAFSRLAKLPRRNETSYPQESGMVRFVVWDNANSRALANAQVVLMGAEKSPSEDFRASGTSQTDGVVDIQGVVRGVYVVRSRHASCQAFDSGIFNLKPNEIHRIIMDCPPVNSTGDRRTTQPATPSRSGSSEEQLVAEYRMLLPLALEKNKKPWHTRVNLVANAVKQGSGYHVNYQAFCLIEQGPDKGKDYPCSEFETVLDLGGIKSAVADMKRQLGR